jgi:hypothetical protein
MTSLPLPLQTVYAELLERCLAAQMRADFPEPGTFVKQTHNERIYWYFQSQQGGRQRQKYVGPDSEELRARIDRHRKERSSERERRQMVAALRRARFPAPDPMSGRVLEALARAGVFRLRTVVVGTVAYQTYPAILGVRLAESSTRTDDLDLAQFHSVSVAVGDAADMSLGEILRTVDPGFKAVPYATDARHSMRYALETGYNVEVLMPNRGPDRDEPSPLPALKAEAQPLRFLDFLIREEIPAVAMHGAGIAINVPAPERYAIHKLLVGRRRRRESAIKIRKDFEQAAHLLDILSDSRRFELREMWNEAYGRGPTWRKLLGEGLALIPPRTRDVTLRTVDGRRSIVDGLDITFAAPPLRYRADRDIVSFAGDANGERVHCGVTHEAIEDFAEVESLDREGCLQVVRANRSVFEDMVRAKYLEWPVEQPGEVLVKALDIEDLRKQVG